MEREQLYNLVRQVWPEALSMPVFLSNLDRFAGLVAAAEREACAMLCDAKADAAWAWWKARAHGEDQGAADCAGELAAAIRARSNDAGA